jgi:hypothetical protein
MDAMIERTHKDLAYYPDEKVVVFFHFSNLKSLTTRQYTVNSSDLARISELSYNLSFNTTFQFTPEEESIINVNSKNDKIIIRL